MAVPALQAFQYADVAAILPQHKKDVVEDKANQARANLTKSYAKETANHWPIAVAIGAIICLAGVFLTLAAHQVLPHGINAISNLGIWGQGISYGCLAIGVIVTAVGALKWYFHKQAQHENIERDVSSTRYNAEVAEMDAYFPNRLQGTELFAVDNPSRKELTIYYMKWIDRANCVVPAVAIIAYQTSAESGYQAWSLKNLDNVKYNRFINLGTLKQRTEEFESRKEVF